MIYNPKHINMISSLFFQRKSCLRSARGLTDSVRSIGSTCALFFLFGLSLIGCESAPCPHGTVLDGFVPSSFKEGEVAPPVFEGACVIESGWGKVRHGLYRKWSDHGRTLRAQYQYEGGLRQGEYKIFYEDGSFREEGSYIFDLRHGRYVSRHRNGNLHVEGKYADGKRQGDFTIYSDNGKNIQKGPYFIGQKHGKWSSAYIPLRGETVTIYSFFHYGQIATEL